LSADVEENLTSEAQSGGSACTKPMQKTRLPLDNESRKNPMIHVIATITAHPGKRDAFLAEFHRIMPMVHAEPGCIEYGPTVDIASGVSVQGPLRDNIAVIIEKWESLDALKAHMQAPHMVEYRMRVKELVESVTLQILTGA
jgi:quinol monooxygenase YgiN